MQACSESESRAIGRGSCRCLVELFSLVPKIAMSAGRVIRNVSSCPSSTKECSDPVTCTSETMSPMCRQRVTVTQWTGALASGADDDDDDARPPDVLPDPASVQTTGAWRRRRRSMPNPLRPIWASHPRRPECGA